MISLDIPGVGTVDFPEDMSDADIKKAIETEILPQARAQQASTNEADDYWSGRGAQADQGDGRPGILAQFGSDIRRGASQMQQLGYGLGALGADVVGADQTAKSLLQSYQDIGQDIATNNPPTIGSYTNIGSVGDALRYGVEAVGENALMALPSLVTGGIGAVAARRLAQTGAAEFVESQVAKGVAREVAEQQAGTRLARAATVGGVAGAYPPAAGMEMGSIYGDVYEQTGEQAPGTAIAIGAIAGALDTVGEGLALRRMFGRELTDTAARSLVGRLGVAGAEQFVTEAPTEALQTILERTAVKLADPSKDVFSDQGVEEIINAGLKGGIGGAGVGVVSESTGSLMDWARRRGVEPTQENLEAAASAGDPEALNILRSAGMSEAQVTGLSPERAAAFAERINARRAAEAEREAPEAIIPDTMPPPIQPDIRPGMQPWERREAVAAAREATEKRDRELLAKQLERNTTRGAQKAAKTEAERNDREVERRRLEAEGLASGDIDPGAVSRRARPVIPETIQLGDRRLDGRLTAGNAADPGLEQAVDIRGRSNLPANIAPPYRPHTPEEVAHQQAVMARQGRALNAGVDAPVPPGTVPPPNMRTDAPTPIMRDMEGFPVVGSNPEETKQLRQRLGIMAENQATKTNRLLGSENRLVQTPDQAAEERKAAEAFRLVAGKQGPVKGREEDLVVGMRPRVGEGVRDVRAGGRSVGGIESQQTIFMDEGRPVEILSSRTVQDRQGNSHTIHTVRQFDPRTGQPEVDENGEAFEYEIPAVKLTQGRYAIEPEGRSGVRMAQEFEGDPKFEDRGARAPVVEGYVSDKTGKKVKPSSAGQRADEMQKLPRQTYRTTDADPTVPGAEGPTSGVDPRQFPPDPAGDNEPWMQPSGPVLRSRRPDQGAGGPEDQGSGGRGPNMRGDQTRAEADARAEAARLKRMWEQAFRQERQDEATGEDTDWGKAKNKYEGQTKGYSGKPKGVDADGWPEVDEYGFVLSDAGGPIRFSPDDKGKSAMVTRLRELRAAHPNANIVHALHPGPEKTNGKGSTPYWTIQALNPKPAKAQPQAEAAPEPEQPQQPAGTPPALPPAEPEPAPEPDTASVPETSTENVPTNQAIMDAFGGDFEKLNHAVQALTGKVGLNNLTDDEKRQVMGTLRPAPAETPKTDTADVPKTDTEAAPAFDPEAPENAERAGRLRAIADRYEAIGNQEKAEWHRSKIDKPPHKHENLDGWERLAKLDEEKAAGMHTVTQPAKRGPVAPKLIDNIDDNVRGADEETRLGENVAEGMKHVPAHIRKAATDKLNDLRRLRAERGYNGDDEPLPNMKPQIIKQIDSDTGALEAAYSRYTRFLGAFKLGRKQVKYKDGKTEPLYTVETVGRELKKLQAEIARQLPTDVGLDESLAKWSVFQLDNFINTYGERSEDGSRALAELRRRPGWGNRRPGEVLKERQKIIRQLKAKKPPANYAELEAKAADLEEDLARDPTWETNVRREFDRRDGQLVNMTPRQIAQMMRESAAEERERAAGLKTKKAKENSEELARSYDWQAERLENQIVRATGTDPDLDPDPDPDPDTADVPENDTEEEPNFVERRIREGGGREPGRRGAERGEPFRQQAPLSGENLIAAAEKALRARQTVPKPKAIAKHFGVSERDAAGALASIAARGDGVIRQVKPSRKEIKAQMAGEPAKSPRYRLTPQSDQEMSLLEFLASKGGLRRNGDLVAMDAHRKTLPRYGMLVRKEGGGGMSLDEARELAETEGYIGQGTDDYNSTTERDLLEAIDEELRGNRVMPDRSSEETAREQMEGIAGRLDIPFSDETTDAELEAEIDERMALMADSMGDPESTDAIEDLIDGMLSEMGIFPEADVPFGDERGSNERAGQGAGEVSEAPGGTRRDVADGPAGQTADVQEGAGASAEGARSPAGTDRQGTTRPPVVGRGGQLGFGDILFDDTPPRKAQEPEPADVDDDQIDIEEAIETDRQRRAGLIQPIDPAAVPDPTNGREPPADAWPRERLLIMSCGIDKSDAPGNVPAIERYTGPRFHELRKWMAANPGQEPHVVILSGKFNFIDGKQAIPNYDQKMTADRADKLIRDGAADNGALDAAHRYRNGYRDVFIIGGAEYTRPINAAVTQLVQAGVIREDAAINRAAGGAGIQKKQMMDWVGRATGNVPENDTGNALERLQDQVQVFASGMSAPQELSAGLQAWSGMETRGIGVEIGRLSNPGIETLARAVVDRNAAVFVDSGAYGLGMAEARGAGGLDDLLGELGPVKPKPLNFDEVLAKYDRILDRIAELNGEHSRDMDADSDLSPEEAYRLHEDDRMGRGAEEDRQAPLFVMPDIVRDQAGSIELARRYRDHIRRHIELGVSRPIVPIQKGELSLTEAYNELTDILGTDDFVVGIPAATRAISDAELRDFLTEVRPSQVHILGGASPATLTPKLRIMAEAGIEPDHLSADANILRAALWGQQAAGTDRQTAVRDTLVKRAGKELDEQVNGPERTESVPKKGTQKTVDGTIVVATGKPDMPWAGGRYVEKGPQAGWQPDTAAGYGNTPEEAAAAVMANRKRNAAEQRKREAEANHVGKMAERAGKGETITADEARSITRYGDGKTSTTAATAFLRGMGLSAKQADTVMNSLPTLDRSEGGAWLYDMKGVIEAGQRALGIGMAPKSSTGKVPAWMTDNADAIAGRVVWWDEGRQIGLAAGYSVLSGQPVYVGVKGTSRTRVDIASYTGKNFSDQEKADLIAAKEADMRADAEAFAANPDGPFAGGKGLAASPGMPKELVETAREWLDMLGIPARVYLTTTDEARTLAGMHGPFAAIRSAGIDPNEFGSTRRLPNGDHYIALKLGGRASRNLETLAHEMGHILEKEAYASASDGERSAIHQAWEAWVKKARKGSAKELVESLRAHTTAKQTRTGEGQAALNMPPYWTSFSEWFADQVSRWAMSSEAPQSVVDKFFRRLANGLRKLYAAAAGKKFLPDAEMAKWLDRRAATSVQPLQGSAPAAPTGPDRQSRQKLSIFDRLRGVEEPIELSPAEQAKADAEWMASLDRLAPAVNSVADIRKVLSDNVAAGVLDKGTADGIKDILDRIPTAGLKGVRLVVQTRLSDEDANSLELDQRPLGEYITGNPDSNFADLKMLVVQAKQSSRQGVHTFLHENAHALFDMISADHKAEARRIYDRLGISRHLLHTSNYSKAERFEEWFAESMADHYIGQVQIAGNKGSLLRQLDDLLTRLYKRIVDVFSGEKAQVATFFDGLEFGLGRSAGTVNRRAQHAGGPFAILTNPVSTLIGEPKAWRMGAKELARDVTDLWAGRGQRANRQSFLGGLARAYAFSADGEYRSAIGRFNSPTMRLLADTFHPQAGSAHRIDPDLAAKLGMKLTGNATFNEAVTRKVNIELQNLDRILNPFREDKAAMDRIVTLVQNPGSRRGGPESDAASKIAMMLKNLHKYMTDSGVDLGQIKNGYFPREIDQHAVIRDAAGFLDAATKAYKASGLSAKEAREAAEHWQTSVLYGGEGSPVRKGSGGSPSFVQSRILSKQADQILAKYYQRDPDAILGSYINRAVKRAEIAKRFGDNWRNWEEIEKQIRKEDPAAGGMFDHLRSYAATATGTQQHNVPGLIRSGSSLIRTFTTLSLLEKSTFSSLAEAITPAIRTGNPLDFLPAITKTLNELRRELMGMPPSLAAELAADIGAIAGSGVNSVMAARFAGGDPYSRGQARVLSSYFRRIGLEQWTNATLVSSTERGAIFLRRLARDVTGQGLNPKSSRMFLAELGIDPKDTDEFAKFVNGFQDDLPTPAQLDAGGAMGEAYRTALLRFDDQTIMKPNQVTRPRWASHPIGAIAFQLQAFTYSFSKNVLLRSARLAKRGVTEKDLSAVDRALFLAPLMMLPALAMTQALVGELRDYLFMDPERRKAETRAAKIEKAISRAGLTGALDPYVQMLTGARYSKDPISTVTGPALGIFGQGLTAGIQWAANNSPNTNAAERKVVESLYDILFEPGANMLLGFAPVAPLTALATTGLLPAMRDNFVDSLAGKRIGHKQQKVFGLSELMMGKQFRAKEGSWAAG